LHGSVTRICLLELCIKCLYDGLSFILLALVLQQVAKHDGLTLLQEASEVASHHASAKMVSDKDLRINFSMSSNFRGIICVLHCYQVKNSVTSCQKIQQDAFTMDACYKKRLLQLALRNRCEQDLSCFLQPFNVAANLYFMLNIEGQS
jgi:hypothetical protein